MVENVWRCEGDDGVLFVNEITFPDHIDTKFYDEDYEQVAPLTKKWKRKIAQKGGFAIQDFLTDGKDMMFEGGQLDILGDGHPLTIQVEGEMRLTGEDVEISGDTYAKAETRLVGRIGPLKYLKNGDAYIDSQTRTIFNGAFSHGVPPNLTTVNSHPVAVIREGDTGFMTKTALHGCNEASG